LQFGKSSSALKMAAAENDAPKPAVSSGDASSTANASAAAAATPTAALKALVSVGLWISGKKTRLQLWKAAAEAVKVSAKDEEAATLLPEPVVKAVCRTLPAALTRLTDGASRRAAVQLVEALLAARPDTAATALTTALFDTFGPWRRLSPTPGAAKTATVALRWAATVHKVAR